MNKKFLTLLFIFVVMTTAMAAPVPQFSQDKHMGVATCASGVCHGKSSADSNSNVMLNEYRVWLGQDDHSGAYKTLLQPQSKKIANRLGLSSAHTAKICLDCHADNVPQDKRGRRFQITDGVGCEACHGGAERWLSDHSEDAATHQSNINLGLYPSEKPRDRANLCLSCHLGTNDKFTTHRIMGAGHPRLSFELESFTFNQPAHYRVDADYEQRKGSIKSMNMWLTGLIYKANQQLDLLQSDRFRQHGMFPELAFYECHSCHRPMAISRLPVENLSQNLPAGSVRLEDSALVLLSSVLEVIDNSTFLNFKSSIVNLHRSSLVDSQAIQASSQELQKQISLFSNQLIETSFSTKEKKEIRKKLIENCINGLFKDFSSAEQVFMAVETISIDLKDDKAHQVFLDRWFESVKDEDDYIPSQFISIANNYIKGFN